MACVELYKINKSYGRKKALDNVSINVRQNSIHGLLGPNGSGKSTIINILSGTLEFDDGQCRLFNKDIRTDKSYIQGRVGIVPQEYSFYADLKAAENIYFFGRLYGLKGEYLKQRVNEVLRLVDLEEYRNSFPDTFSGGLKRRLNIACALVHNPKLIIMDEPTANLDPLSREYILGRVKALNQEGCTVIYTTHYLEEIEQICNEVSILKNGKVLLNESTGWINREIAGKRRIVIAFDRKLVYKPNINYDYIIGENGSTIVLECYNPSKVLKHILPKLDSCGLNIIDVSINRISLDQIYKTLLEKK